MLTRILKEPLLHFMVIGGLLFVVFAQVSDAPPVLDKPQITITPEIVQRLSAGFEATWRRPPTADQIERLVDSHILEEVLVREALDLSLDQNDAVIRSRLGQKMEFLISASAQPADPSDAQLQAHLDANPDRFNDLPMIAFEQVYLGEQTDPAKVAATLDALSDSVEYTSLGERSLLPQNVPLSRGISVDGSFGQGVFDAISKLETGVWEGPVASGFGQHLIRVTEAFTPPAATLDAVREAVEQDWRAEQVAMLSEQQFSRLRENYTILRADQTQ